MSPLVIEGGRAQSDEKTGTGATGTISAHVISLGFNKRLTSANLRVFFCLPIRRYSMC